MVKKPAVPDAWDDDWETQADVTEEAASTNVNAAEEQVKISKAERLVKHEELNKQIWQSADQPETFHFLAASDNVPLKAEFRPALKVLSRKPAPKIVSRQDPLTGLSQMTLEDDEEEDEGVQKSLPTAEELRLKAQREREEKQKKYEEVRARLFGTLDAGSGNSSPGTITPPTQVEDGRGNRGKSRGRGGSSRQEGRRLDAQGGTRELYDPNSTPKAGSSTTPRRVQETLSSGRSTPRVEEQIIRAPRGPDGSGRGGFGFAKRGGKDG